LEELARLHQNRAPGSAPGGGSQPDTGTGDARSVRPDREYFGPAATPGDACDATIVPILTGRVDHDLLAQLTATLTPTASGQPPDSGSVSDLILANAVALLSGPGQLASLLRTGTLDGPAASVSLPIDLGTATETIPAHLRRAVIARDRHCMAPGCFTPAAGCHIHHTTPKSQGGPTSLKGLILFCPFHHLIVVHQWGWSISLNPDGTTTMTNPSGTKIYHSHSPPPATAA
ncbi:MAG TPA: HNH endonuclease signature motif containing protein, partial [Streptosporangiaceae bacterium]|nr:HNH endonuclease signature motif containing protein [Streptosporangiaceae bacterium]